METQSASSAVAAPVRFVSPVGDPSRLPLVELIVADNDIPCRPEQNRMMARSLTHMGWPEECVRFREMKGYGHCGYDRAAGPDGSLVFPRMIEEFVREAEALAGKTP